MIYEITNQNLVVLLGGHKNPGLGARTHYPIFRGKDGTEYVSLNGQTLTPVANLKFGQSTRRETVTRK